RRAALILFCLFSATIMSFFFIQHLLGQNLFSFFNFFQKNTPNLDVNQITYYSFKYIKPNILFYSRAIAGQAVTILWMVQPITSFRIFLMGLTGSVLLLKEKRFLRLSI